MTSVTTPRSRTAPRQGLRHHVRAQLGVGVGQVVAGAGNLAFSVIAARMLDPGAFATLTAFLALSLLVAVPAGSLAAGSLLSAELHDRLQRSLRRIGVITSLALAAGVATVGPSLGLPRALALPAAALPVIALGLALARAQLYAHRRPGAVVITIVAEPVVRVVLGVGLLVALGATGGAAAVALGGAVALLVARRALPDRAPLDAGRLAATTGGGGVAAFLALALVQNQDVLVVNARLAADVAGSFAALSMLGGAALFAVWNAPMVLMPRTADDRSALPAALGVTAAAGAVATAVAFLTAPTLVELLVGATYLDAADLLGPYVGAMALLGLARVLAGHRCAHGHVTSTAVLAATAAAGQVAALLTVDTLSGAAWVTVGTTAVLATSLSAAALGDMVGARAPSLGSWAPVRARVWADAPARVATLATFVGLGLRLLSTRGLWLDEAISVAQARMPFGAMLQDIATTDVHPPLHHMVLWVWMRVFGDGEFSVRLPFVLIGAALVPLLFVVGRDLYSRRAGAAAACLGAVAPLAVWYSQETRMYSLYMLFSLVAVWGQVRTMRRGRVPDWALLVVGTAGLLWTHWFALLQVAVMQAILLVHVVRRRRRREDSRALTWRWLLAVGAIVLLLAPLVPVLVEQLASFSGRSADLASTPSQAGTVASGLEGDLSVYRLAVNGVWALLGYHANETMVLLVALWPLAMLAAFAMLGRGPWRRGTHVVVAVATVPLLALFALGGMRSNLFEVRYVIGSLPALLLLLGRAAALPRRRAAVVVATGALVVGSAAGLVDQQVNADNPRLYAFDDAVREAVAEADTGDVVAYAPYYIEPVVEYYAPGVETQPLRAVDPTEVDGDIHVIGSFLDKEPEAGRIGTELARLEQTRALVETHTTGNITLWTFS